MKSTRLLVIGGLLLTIGLALFVSPWASSEPDGLEKVATDNGFIAEADEHALADSPVADYSVDGVDNERVSTALSGLIGVMVTFGVGMVLFGGLQTLKKRREVTGSA